MIVHSVADAFVIVAAYLWGSLSPSAFIARRVRGVDLSRYGSGNVGSSNLGALLGAPRRSSRVPPMGSRSR